MRASKLPQTWWIAAAMLGVIVGISSAARAAVYVEDFEVFPNSRSAVSGGAEVGHFPQCRSGACWRGTWNANESAAGLRPDNGNFKPSNDRMFARAYIRVGDDFASGSPAVFKFARLIANQGDELDLYIWNNFIEMNNTNPEAHLDTNTLCSVPFRPDQNVGRWVKIEWYWQHNTPGNSDGECRLWVTMPDGTVLSDVRTSLRLYDNPGIQRLAWVFGNVSNYGSWPYATKTFYLDDVCIGDSLSARDGICGGSGTNSSNDGDPPAEEETLASFESFCPGGAAPDPNVLFCDSFEEPRTLSADYFEYDSDEGDFVPVLGEGLAGSSAMRALWQPGEESAGGLKRSFGRNPAVPGSSPSVDLREIYWRMYVRTGPGWSGAPYKLSRATSLVSSNWAQAMIAHLWTNGSTSLSLDPASGTDVQGNLKTTKYNDFTNIRWLGARSGVTPVFDAGNANEWFCVEAHVRLNTPGSSDGIFESWVNDEPDATLTGLNWVGAYQSYGVNTLFVENHWNGGAPGERIRYLDNLAISTRRIYCANRQPARLGPPGKPTLVN